MRLLYKVCTVLSICLLSGAFIAVFATVTSAAEQKCIEKTIWISSASPNGSVTPGTMTTEIVLRGQCKWEDGTYTSGLEGGAVVTFKYGGKEQSATTNDAGLASATFSTDPTVSFWDVSVVDTQNGQYKTLSATYNAKVVTASTPSLTPTEKIPTLDTTGGTPTPTASVITPNREFDPTSTATTPAIHPFNFLPGFEVVYAVAGLLIVAYLVIQRRK